MRVTRRGGAGRPRALGTLLRRPALVVFEVAGLALGSVLAVTLPQESAPEELRRFGERLPALSLLTRALGLHDILTSAWFLALAALAVLSLVAVQLEQWTRLRRVWRGGVDAASFSRAPYRREIPLSRARREGAPRFTTSGKVSVLGSPVFHLGLLIVVAAGVARLLVFRDAMTRVVEGETLAAASAFDVERGGALSAPFVLPEALRIEEIRPSRYPSGALEQVSVRVGRASRATTRGEEVAINAPLDLGATRLYATTAHGVAALIEVVGPAGTDRTTAWLEPGEGDYRGGLRLAGGYEVRLRTGSLAPRPDAVEVRTLRDGVILGVASMPVGAEVRLGDDRRLRLVGLPYWIQLRGSRDPSRPVFYLGAAIGIAGVGLMFGVTRVDSGVFVEGDSLVVALKPQRFAPLYSAEFERLVKEWHA